MRRTLPLLVTALLSSFLTSASTYATAQNIRVGVVLSTSGSAARLGRTQREALETLQRAWRNAGGTYSSATELVFVDDMSLPLRTATEVTRLVEEGVQAVVCCTTDEAARAVAGVAADLGVPLLSLSTPTELANDAPYWIFGVGPSSKTLLQRMVLDVAAGPGGVALMAPRSASGDAAKDALAMLLAPGSLGLAAEARYPIGASVLTPEALWVAAQEPGGVIVWGGAREAAVAVRGLRARGFEGPIYVDPALRDPLALPFNPAPLNGTLTVVSPAELPEDLSEADPTFAETRDFLATTARFRFGEARPHAARAWDALLLLGRALEQTSLYGVAPGDPGFRQALRDALVGLGPVAGAGAVYDFSEAEHAGVLAASLKVARLERGEPVPVR